MAQITKAQRIDRVNELLKELNKQPPERHEVERLPWGGDPLLCPVIKIPVEEVLLNHRSHRVRAQLQDDPQWHSLSNDPHSESAQRVIEQHVRNARTAAEFGALKDSLLREGQTAPGVMTHDGVLVNANTRAVAMISTIESWPTTAWSCSVTYAASRTARWASPQMSARPWPHGTSH